MTSPTVPVLEVGGTHVTGAAVDVTTWTVLGRPTRLPLDASASADALVATMLAAAATVPAAPGADWGVAMPDPFDYAHGIALFAGVGKFESLYGVDLGARLGEPLRARPHFVNDADAFALGEWVHGAATGATRCCGLTLGTGVGSGWLIDGRVVDPGIPSGGRAHHLLVDGQPLEDVMSRRAIRRAYAKRTGAERTGADTDVRQISDRARTGDADATAVLRRALVTLGSALGPPVRRFGAEVLVVGGSMSASWDLFEPWFAERAGPLPDVRVAADAEHAALLGAALVATRAR